MKRKWLTNPEKDVADLLCQGFSCKEISRKLKVPYGTIQVYTRNFRKIYHGRNTPEAIANYSVEQMTPYKNAWLTLVQVFGEQERKQELALMDSIINSNGQVK